MSSDIWNPWHGCRKYSEGCDHCYMYYLDSTREKSGREIYKVKTNFKLPLKKDRQGQLQDQKRGEAEGLHDQRLLFGGGGCMAG